MLSTAVTRIVGVIAYFWRFDKQNEVAFSGGDRVLDLSRPLPFTKEVAIICASLFRICYSWLCHVVDLFKGSLLGYYF